MNAKSIFESKTFSIGIRVLIALIALLLAFKAGTVVGERKARFAYRWGENYHRNFGGPHGGFMHDMMDGDFTDAHGVFGQVLKVDGQTIVIRGRDQVEKLVTVGQSTVIRQGSSQASLANVAVDDFVVVIGEPDDAGEIAAKFVRIMPPPPAGNPAGAPTPSR